MIDFYFAPTPNGWKVAIMSFARSLPGRLDAMDWAAAARAVAEMQDQGRAILGRTIDADTVTFRRFADMAGHIKAKGGHELVVYNRTKAKAEQWAAEHGCGAGQASYQPAGNEFPQPA